MEPQKTEISVLHVTTGYPRKAGDVFGSFIADTNNVLGKRIPLTVLAPGDEQTPSDEKNGLLTTRRFSYWPFGKGRVAYGQGIPTNLRSWGCRFQLPFFIVSFLWNILRDSKEKDLIHAHWGISGVLAYLASRIRRIPLVVSFHGSDLHGHALIQKASRWIAKKSHTNICVSEDQAQHLGAPCQIISYPIDTHRFHPLDHEAVLALRKSWALPTEQPLILMVGYLIPLKRVDLAIRALSLMDSGHLVIAGEGDERPLLKSLVSKLDLEERVTFLGSVSYQKIHEIFQIADLHFLCSEREGKPNVIYQAMATGIPTLSTPVGGVPEQIADGESGRLLEPIPEAFAEAGMSLIQHQDQLKQMGIEANIKLHALKIDPESISKKFETLYKKIL
jgi:glycosyltransferase involved in cell wall biosynthesis